MTTRTYVAVRCLLFGLILLLATSAPAFAAFQGVVETPTEGSSVTQPFTISGWAIDTASGSGPGVDVMSIWICPVSCDGSNGIHLGYPPYGSAKPAVASQYGSQFLNSGYSRVVGNLAPGPYYMLVQAHSTVTGQWNTWVRTFTVLPGPTVSIETPTAWSSVAQPFTISGWAIQQGAPSGPGVDVVSVWAYPNPGSGAEPVYLGAATYGINRPDVSATYGTQYANSGFSLTVSGQLAAAYHFSIGIRNTIDWGWTIRTLDAYVDTPTVTVTIDRQGTGTGGVSATNLSCAGGSGTQAVPCGTSYALGSAITFTAQPDSGMIFSGWMGACTGTGTCQLTMTGSKFVTARFDKIPTTTVINYYHTDAIGSVRAITNEAGATVIRHDYSPFGEDPQPLTGDPMRFGGKQLDAESGMHYFEARYFRNTWGRFATIDPAGGSTKNPQRFNRYAYAGNNPLKFVDPNGTSYLVWNGVGGGVANWIGGYVENDEDFWSMLSSDPVYAASGNVLSGNIVLQGSNTAEGIVGGYQWVCGEKCAAALSMFINVNPIVIINNDEPVVSSAVEIVGVAAPSNPTSLDADGGTSAGSQTAIADRIAAPCAGELMSVVAGGGASFSFAAGMLLGVGFSFNVNIGYDLANNRSVITYQANPMFTVGIYLGVGLQTFGSVGRPVPPGYSLGTGSNGEYNYSWDGISGGNSGSGSKEGVSYSQSSKVGIGIGAYGGAGPYAAITSASPCNQSGAV